MLLSESILYISHPLVDDGGSLFVALTSIGYDVLRAHSASEAIVLAANPSICAAVMKQEVIQISESEAGFSVAEKLKFVNPEMHVVLVAAEAESNRPLPPFVDAVTFSEAPDEAACAITAFLDSQRPKLSSHVSQPV